MHDERLGNKVPRLTRCLFVFTSPLRFQLRSPYTPEVITIFTSFSGERSQECPVTLGYTGLLPFQLKRDWRDLGVLYA